MTDRGRGYASAMARRIREEIIDDDPVVVSPAPVTRRVVTERRTGGPAMRGMNPVAMALAAVLLVFILVLVFGVLL